MKLEKAHIENFGKLKNFDVQFNEESNLLLENNGWGKSTLAAFIRIMFFGFQNENKSSVVENERKKYDPWQGGVYGGQLTFAVGKKKYRIERTFGKTKSEDRFVLTKAGWFLLNDESVRINMDFIHEVCYQGLFYMEETLREGRPAGLEVFGKWPTIYEGLSQLPREAQKKWFAFDHHYSDNSFQEALEIVFSSPVKKLLDVGGNTGRWAMQCIGYNPEVEVTIMDLPQQLGLMREATRGKAGADRIKEYPANLLDPKGTFPKGFDVIWMSQFLDCFSQEEVISILRRAAEAMDAHTLLYILESYWDRQQYETGAYCLTQISLYFSVMANGNSKMYYSQDMIRCAEQAGLTIEKIYDDLGKGHSIFVCKLAN